MKFMKVRKFIGKTKIAVGKYSPEILLSVGIAGMAGSVVLACKATLRCDELLEEHQDKMDKIEECWTLAEEGNLSYTEEEMLKDKQVAKVQTVVNFVLLYGPPALLFGASTACLISGHRIMTRRQMALVAAYNVLSEAFQEYRRRVVEELGESKDAHFRYGTDTITDTATVTDENGKKNKVKTEIEKLAPGAKLSGFARIFEPQKTNPQTGSWTGSSQFTPIHDYNLVFLNKKMEWFNDKLEVTGLVTMYEVLEELGMTTTESSLVSGWRSSDGNEERRISFKPRGIDGNWAFGRDGDSIILDFNIDGVIFDENIARKEW